MEKNLRAFLDLADLFKTNGFDLYLVGGTVRDFLMSKHLNDMDVVTNATPIEMQNFISGDYRYAKLGSVKTKFQEVKFDITTLRKEHLYSDSRHPSKIEFVSSLKQDYVRRDFTINAMYMDTSFKVIDFCKGELDLSNNVIRMVGKPSKRIKEDPLRILRAIRFKLDFSFYLDKKLEKAIYKNIYLLEKLNIEKIKQEIHKIKCDNKQEILKVFEQFNIKHLLDVIE